MGMIVSLGLIHSMGLMFLTHSLLHTHAHPLPQGSTNPALETPYTIKIRQGRLVFQQSENNSYLSVEGIMIFIIFPNTFFCDYTSSSQIFTTGNSLIPLGHWLKLPSRATILYIVQAGLFFPGWFPQLCWETTKLQCTSHGDDRPSNKQNSIVPFSSACCYQYKECAKCVKIAFQRAEFDFCRYTDCLLQENEPKYIQALL